MYWVASRGHSWDPSWPINRLSLLNTCSAQEAATFARCGASATSCEDPPRLQIQQERRTACLPDSMAVQAHPNWYQAGRRAPRTCHNAQEDSHNFSH